MTIHVNGQERELSSALLVGDLVDEVIPRGREGVAVAVNGVVVRRTTWNDVVVADGDRVEVLVAVQGG